VTDCDDDSAMSQKIYYIKQILQIAFLLHAETPVLFFVLITTSNCVDFESILGGRYHRRGPKGRGPFFVKFADFPH